MEINEIEGFEWKIGTELLEIEQGSSAWQLEDQMRVCYILSCLAFRLGLLASRNGA
jgi:hypothetical protein